MYLQPLLAASPAIQIHALAAIAAFLLGALTLFRRKGDRLHRLGGRIWVALMVVVALSSFFIREIRMIGEFSPIHLLSVVTLVSLVYGVREAQQHRIAAHRYTMQSIYFGALIIAGLFTLLPGRIMHEVMFARVDDGLASLPAWLVLIAILLGLVMQWRRVSTAR